MRRFDTIAVHGVYKMAAALANQGSIMEPVYLSTAQHFEDSDRLEAALAYREPAWAYTRIANPTTNYLEATLGPLEGYGYDGEVAACVTASGMAASVGSRRSPDIVVDPRCYGGTFTLFTERYERERGVISASLSIQMDRTAFSQTERPDERDGALGKSLTVLEMLVSAAPQATLAAIADGAGLGKPTTHRILQQLVARGYARTDGDGSYGPGPQILALSGQVLATLDYQSHARAALWELQTKVPETIHLAILSGRDLFYADKLEGMRPYRMASRIGMRLEPHSSAIGKAVLAYLPAEECDALLEGRILTAQTSRTITDRAELAAIRDCGFAVDDEENEDGVRCVGAPVFGVTGRVVGAISVSAPAFQLPIEHVPETARSVMEAGVEVSRLLGAPQAPLAEYRRLAQDLPEPVVAQPSGSKG